MSLVLQPVLCPKCQAVGQVLSRTANVATCKAHGKFFYKPGPEPTVEELNLALSHSQARINHYVLCGNPSEYQKLVDNSLAVISRENKYLELLAYSHENHEALRQAAESDKKSLELQREALIKAKAAATREVVARRTGPAKNTISKESKLRLKLTDTVYEQLLSALGGDKAKLEQALKA